MSRKSRAGVNLWAGVLLIPCLISACRSNEIRSSATAAATTDPRQSSYTQLGTACTERECLFATTSETQPPLGIVTLKGYYSTNSFALPGPQTTPALITCDEIVVTDGPQEFLQWFRDLIEIGNSINRITDENRLAMAINLDSLSEDEQVSIRSSALDAQVEVLVLSPTPVIYSTALKCMSWIRILKVN